MTGDLAEIDNEGFIYLRDRSEYLATCAYYRALNPIIVKDMIIRGGENIVGDLSATLLYHSAEEDLL